MTTVLSKKIRFIYLMFMATFVLFLTGCSDSGKVPVSVELYVDKTTLEVNETTNLQAIIHYNNNTSENVTSEAEWIIVDDNIVSIDVNGTLKALKDGTTIVNANVRGILSNDISIDVVSPVSNVFIEELQNLLNDPTIPYATDVDFNNTEYAKNHLPDDEAEKLERAHMLVATAIDPDPAWFYTDVDKSVMITEAGTDHTINLYKLSKEGIRIGAVDNDKLRLVVRIQRSKDEFEYITNVNIDQYAYWDEQGVLKIHIPNDLDRGRLLVGVRPNFDDVATTAIAERWSTAIVAEVWQTKQGVKTVDTDVVLFPIDDNTSKGFSSESIFTKDDITPKVTTELFQNNTLMLPMVIKEMSLQEGDLLSYVFQGKPYSGKVMYIETRGTQQFVMLLPTLFDVYDITDAEDGFMIKEGIYPENVIIREGERLATDKNESDPVAFTQKSAKSVGNEQDFFKKSCELGDAGITFKTIFSLSPLDVGIDLSLYGMEDAVKCTWEAKAPTDGLSTISPGFFAVSGPLVIIMNALGASADSNLFGNLEIAANMPLGYNAGYSIDKGGHYKINNLFAVGSRDLNDEPYTAKGEISATFGMKLTFNAVSADGYIGYVMSWLGISIPNIGLEASAGLKPAFVAEGKNAKEVRESGSSTLALSSKIDIKVEPSEDIKSLLKSLSFPTTLEFVFNADVIDPLKAKVDYRFNDVEDDGQGHASLIGLDFNSYLLHKILPESKGVLSLKDSSVYNDQSEEISYDVEECAKDPGYKITSPAIGCAGPMCGQINKSVELCKGSLTISKVVASARVEAVASTYASMENKEGNLTVKVSGCALEPQPTFNDTPINLPVYGMVCPLPNPPQTITIDMPENSEEDILFKYRCPSASGTYRGITKISADGTPVTFEADNILVCSKDDYRGDPHIVTGDGLGYDYFASGDYILSRIKDLAGYEIQARFLPGYETSWPQAIALQVGLDKVEIQGRNMLIARTDPFNALSIWINGIKYESNNNIISLPSGGLIAITETKTDVNKKKYPSSVTIVWPEGSQTEAYGVILNVAEQYDPFVHIQIARPDTFAGQERGLMGNNDGNPNNDFIRRNGEVLGVDHNMSFTELYALFGTDWLVRPYESLFRNPEAIEPQFPTDVITLTPEQRAFGEEACRALRGFYYEACVLDVGLTGSVDIVKEYYANTDDLNEISDAIITPDVDRAIYRMDVEDKIYENDSAYFLHYTQKVNVTHESGNGSFMLLVRPPKGATVSLASGESSYVGEGNFSTLLEVDCTVFNPANSTEYLADSGAIQLWLQDPLSGTATHMVNEVALPPCIDESKLPLYALYLGNKEEFPDSNDTHLHYTQTLDIKHENTYAGDFILELTAPKGAIVTLADSSTELNVTDTGDYGSTMELDCTAVEDVNITRGSIILWQKNLLTDTTGIQYAKYVLSCARSQTKLLKTGQARVYADFDDGYYQMGESRSYTRGETNDTVIDNVTGLEWQDNNDSIWVEKTEALIYCHDLILGGYDDWRLPDRKELTSLVDFSRIDPSIDPVFKEWLSFDYMSSSGSWGVVFGNGTLTSGMTGNGYVRCVRVIE